MRDGNGHNGAAEVQRGLPAENENSGNQKGSRRDSPSSPQQQRRRHPCAVSIIASAESTSPISREDKRGNAALPSADAGTAQVDLRISTVSRNKSAADPASVSLLGLSPLPATSVTDSSGPSSSLLPFTSSASHEPLSSMLSGLPCMQRVRGPTSCVNTIDAANAAAAEQSAQVSSVSLSGDLVERQTSSAAATGTSATPPTTAIMSLCSPPSISASSIIVTDLLSPVSYARQRRNAAMSTMRSEEESTDEQQKRMSRRATVPIMSLASTLCRSFYDNDCPARASPSSANGVGATDTTTAATAAVTEEKDNSLSELEVTSPATASIFTCSEFTLTSNALLHRSAAAAAAVDADGTINNGGVVRRRRNTMATLPTQLQQQQKQEDSSTLRPPASTVFGGIMSKLATYQLHFPDYATLEDQSRPVSSQDKEQEQLTPFMLEAYRTHTGDSIMLFEASSNPSDSAKAAPPPPPPPLLSLLPPSAPLSPSSAAAVVATATATSAHKTTTDTSLLTSPPSQAALLPNRPRRSSTTLSGPSSPYHNHRSQNSATSSSGDGCRGSSRCWSTGESVLNVSDQTCELNISDGRRTHPSCGSTPSVSNGRTSVAGLTKDKNSLTRNSSRTDGAAALTTRGDVCYEMARGEGEGLPAGGSEASSSTSAASSSVLLGASSDGFADVVSTGPSLVSSLPLPSPAQSKPLSGEGSKKRSALAAVGASPVAAAGAALRTQRPSVSAVTGSTTSAVSMLTDTTPPSTRSGKLHGHNCSSTNDEDSSALLCNVTPPSRARVQDEAQRPQQQQQQQHRLSQAPAYTLSSLSSAPSKSVSNEAVTPCQPQTPSSTALPPAQAVAQTDAIPEESRRPSPSNNIAGSPSRRGQNAERCGGRGHGYTTSTMKLQNQLTPASDHTVSAPDTTALRSSTLHSPRETTGMPAGKKQDRGTSRIDSHPSSSSSASTHSSSSSPSSRARLSADVLTPLHDSATFPDTATCKRRASSARTHVKDGTEDDEGDGDGNAGGGEDACALPQQQQQSCALRMPLMQFAPQYSTPPHADAAVVAPTAPPPHYPSNPPPTLSQLKQQPQPQQQRHERNSPIHTSGVVQYPSKSLASSPDTAADGSICIELTQQQADGGGVPYPCRDAQRAVASSPLELGNVVAAGRRRSSSSASPVASENPLPSLSTIATVITPLRSVNATTAAAAACGGASNATRQASTTTVKSSNTSPLPRGPSTTSGVAGAGDAPPVRFKSVAGSSGGASPLVRSTEATPPPPPRSASGSTAMATPCHNNNNNSNGSLQRPPSSDASFSLAMTTTVTVTSATGRPTAVAAGSNNSHNNASSASVMNCRRASPVFTGFGFATQTTSNNARTASIPTSTSLSLPPHVRSSSSSNAPPVVVPQSLTTTSQLLTHHSMGSISSTSSMGAFILQGNSTAMMMRRGIPHKMTEVSLPDQSGSYRGVSTSTGNGDDENGSYDKEDNINGEDDDLTSSATYRRSRRAACLSKRGAIGGIKSASHSRRGVARSAGKCRRHSLLKPGTAIELAILNGACTRRPSAVSLLHGGGVGGGGWSIMGRSGMHSAAQHQQELAWPDGEPLEVSLSCAMSFTASSTSASESYISSSYGSLSQAVLKYRPLTAMGASSEGEKNDTSGARSHTSLRQTCFAVPASSSSLSFPSGASGEVKKTRNAEKHDAGAVEDSCVLYAAAPVHFHFYRTVKSHDDDDDEPHQQSSSAPLQLPRYERPQLNPASLQSSPSAWWESASPAAATTAAAPNAAAAAVPQVVTRQREKRHHRYVRVHHRRCTEATPLAHDRNFKISPPPPPEKDVIEPLQPPSSLLREPKSEESSDSDKKTSTAAGSEDVSLVRQDSDKIGHRDLSPPSAAAATTPRKASTPPQQSTPPPRAIYSPHLSTSSLLYYDDVDSDAVDDVYYQLEKRLFPVKAEEELQLRYSLCDVSQSSQEIRDLAGGQDGNENHTADQVGSEANTLDALFTVLDVPLRLNLRGGFHLSDYYAPCPICHPVMRKLAATAAAAAATSTTSTTVSTTISDASDVCSCSQCSCTSSASSSSSSRSSSCDSDGNNINANHCQGHHGSSRSENCSSSTGSSHSSTTSDASVVSSPSSASSTAYTASTPSAGSVLSSVISTTGIGFTFGSGTRLGSAASPPAHRLPSPSNSNSPSSRATASNAAAAAAAATATANAKVGSTRPCGYSGRRNACHSSSAVVAAAGGVSYTSNIKNNNNNNNGCGGSRVNNVRVVSPKDADDHFLVAVPSPCFANDSSTAPSRHRADRDDSSRSIGHADRDAPMPATASTPRATPSSSAVTGASAAAATAAAAPGADRSSSSKLVTTSNNNNSDTTSNTVCTSQPLSSILQRGVSTTSGTLRNATAPLSATKTTASDAPVPPQQQQHSLSSFPPFGHGQLPAFTSTPHSFRSGQVVPISQPMAFTSTRRDSRSLTAGGGATHCRVTSAMSAPHLARYRRVRQRHRPALIVARRRGYYGAGGHTQYSQYSGLMKQRLLCIRVNDKFTYIDPKRATGAAKLVADAALLAERQKRAKEKRQRVQAEEAARKWEATPAAAAADLNEIAEGAPLNVKKTAAAVDEGAAARSYCRHCHRLRRLPRHHRHHHNQQYNPAITENGEKQGDAARTDERTTPASHHHRHHRHHSHHHRRSKGGGSDNGSDLLSQNVGAPWEVHGILPTPRNTTAATGAAGNLERDVNEESIQSSSAYGTPQQQRQRQRQHHLFGDGLACFAAHQSPVPKGPIPARIPAEGTFATVLRRLDTTTSSRSGPPCGHVVAHESPPRQQQQQQQQQRAAFISRTAGRVLHQRVYSSSSCRSPSSSRASAVGATGGVAAAPSSLQGSVSIVSRLRSSSSGSDTNEVPERREQSTLGTNASSDHVNSVGDVLTQPTAAATGAAAMTTMLRAADGTVLPLHSQSSHHSSSGGSPLAPPAFESSHGHPTTPQQSDSALWSVGASVERLMTANSGQVSEDVVAMPVAAVDEAERRSEFSLSRLPHPTTSPPAHGLCDGSRAHKSGGAFGMGGVSASAESKSQSASVNNVRSSGGNAYGRLSYHGEERDAQRIGLAPAPTSLPDMAEMPYSVGSHNLQLHFLNSGRSSSAFSTPTPACPLSLNNNNNNHHSINMTAFVTTPAAAMNPPAPAEESSGAATAGTVEGRQGSHNVQRSTASSTCVTPFNVSAGPVNSTYNIPSRSTSQSGTLVHDNSGVTPLRGQNDPRRSHSGRGRSRSHSRPAQYHRSLASGSSHCHHRHMHLHHRGLSLMSTPLEAETTEADLLNTALAAYPEFASRSQSRSQPRRQQP
ncbi:hypothetical protein N2W54_005434 [Lotmaria passim]